LKLIKKHCIWLVPILALWCVGWADSWEALRATAATVKSVQADFVQEKHLPILARPLVSKGVFYYQAPQSLRWEYRWPVKSILTMHDGRVRRFVEGSAGMTEESGAGLDAMQVVVQEITNWLSGRFNESTVFSAQLDPGGRIVLTPRGQSFRMVIQRIELKLAERPGVIDSVTIYESQKAYTRMIFTHTVLNRRIDKSVFEMRDMGK
jgi:outer membrane lipoprotein carrier protein